ncbi:MAG: hypothetical protein K0S71_2129 [Clostridia bacterium]|nr:hypothetical protein [Clostridia bacterium]
MRKFKMTITLLGLMILMNGCSTLTANAKAASAEQPVKVIEGTARSQKEGAVSQNTKTDTAVQKREAADFTGEISQIIGNEITLKLVNMPEMPQRAESSMQGETQEDNTKAQDKSQPKAITGSTGGEFPGGPGGGFPGVPGGMRGETGSNSNAQRKSTAFELDYTGEEKIMTIPVGMIITTGRGQSGGAFETLQEGSVLSIWLSESGEVEQARLIGGGTK